MNTNKTEISDFKKIYIFPVKKKIVRIPVNYTFIDVHITINEATHHIVLIFFLLNMI